jgi:hypothetical protein
MEPSRASTKFGEQRSTSIPVLSRIDARLTSAVALKRKTSCAPHEPQKVLVVELLLALPDAPDAPATDTVLTASPDHLRQATYSPFDAGILQPSWKGFQTVKPDNFKNISDILIISLLGYYSRHAYNLSSANRSVYNVIPSG